MSKEDPLYALVLTLQSEVKGLRDDFALIKEFMVRTIALDQDRQLPTKIAEQGKRIEALEHALTAAKAFSWFASGLSLLLAIWLAVKEIAGK